MLSEEYIDYIAWDLEARGLTDPAIQEEMLDHICCVVEEKIAAGALFVTAYREAVQAFGPQGLSQIQHAKTYTFHQNSVLMLKATFLTSLLVIGFFSAYALLQNPVELATQESLWKAPLDDEQKITSGFGMRMHPILKQKRMHTGVDFQAPLGTEVYAARDGLVRASGVAPKGKTAYGIIVEIAHDSSFVTYYAHLSEVKVTVGQQVKAGDLIALTGSSGVSMAPHLHFEVEKDGQHINPADFPALVNQEH